MAPRVRVARATQALTLALALALALGALLGAAPARAQEAAQTVAALRFEPPLHGEEPFETVCAAWRRRAPGAPCPFRVGMRHTPEAGRVLLRAALESGTFAEARLSASSDPEGVTLHVRGERRWTVQSVTVTGLRARGAVEVRSDLELAAGDQVTEARTLQALERVAQSYRDLGYNAALAAHRWRETDRPSARALLVDVTEGAPTRIERVDFDPPFEGPLARDVRAALGLSAGDIADPHPMRLAPERMLTVLRREGYLSARVLGIERLDRTTTLQRVVIHLAPGPVYRLAWQGPRAFAPRELAEALRIEDERSLDASTLAILEGRLRTFYQRRGFPDASARAEVASEGLGRAVLRFTITEGVQRLVRRVSFLGARGIDPAQLLEDLQGLLVEELPGATALTAPGRGVEDLFDGAAGSGVPSGHRGGVRLRPEDVYVQDLYDEAARRLVLRYRDRGWLSAAVLPPSALHPRSARTADAPRSCRDAPEFDGEGVRRVDDELGRPTLDVYFCVHEGARTILDEATFEGAREVSTAELARASRLELGAPLRYRDLELARVALTDFYRERAFAFARVDPVLERSPDDSRARVRFVVREGPRVRVGAIHIRGNDRTAEALIRQRLALTEGDWYLLSAVRTSQRRVGELGVFTGVTIALEEPDVEAPVKSVAVYLVERRPQSLETRGGFSTGQGLRAGFEYGYNNLLGRAVGLSLRAEVGYLVQLPGITPAFPAGIDPSTTERVQYRASGSVTFPYVPYLGPDFASSVDLASEARITTDSLSYAYRLVTNGVSLSLLNRTVRGLNLTLTGELQNADLTLFGPLAGAGRDGFLQRYADACAALQDPAQTSACQNRLAMLQQVRFPEGDNLLGALRLGAVFDRRDSAFNPTRGGYLSTTVELLRSFTRPSLPGAPFPATLHLEARGTGYLPLLRWLVLAGSARAGYNLQLSDPSTTHPTRQFLLGGADSMRGWIQNSMVPQDRADQAASEDREDARRAILSVLGGDVYVNVRTELRASTGWPSDAFALSFALFTDLGNLWTDPSAVDLLRLRFSPGVGARVNTPFAVIALDVGFNPFYRELLGEQLWTLQFALGVF